jgi:hypothetical protein
MGAGLAALVRFARAFGLSLLLFPVGLATHEVMHLVVYSAFGVRAALLVTSWRLGSLGVPIFGLHSAPVGPGGVPLGVLVVNNGLGPSLAALLLLALLLSIERRSRVARAALLANVLALVFFSSIELAYPLLEDVGHVNADVLLLPELNYGAVLLILLATTFLATGPWPFLPLRSGGSSTSAMTRPSSSLTTR